MNPTARAHELIRLCSELVVVLERESEILKNRRFSEIAELHPEKAALTAIYESQMKDIAAEPGMFHAIEPALRQQLIDAAETFEDLARKTEISLRAALEMNLRLVGVIADAVQESVPVASGYTQNGTGSNIAAAPSKKPIAVTLDQQF